MGNFDENSDYKLMRCNHLTGNSITHKNSHHKNRVTAKWRKITDFSPLIIKATVVFDYKHAQKLEHEFHLDYSVQLIV